jgi:hypothetical protein
MSITTSRKYIKFFHNRYAELKRSLKESREQFHSAIAYGIINSEKKTFNKHQGQLHFCGKNNFKLYMQEYFVLWKIFKYNGYTQSNERFFV